jgi:Cytidine deaminase
MTISELESRSPEVVRWIVGPGFVGVIPKSLVGSAGANGPSPELLNALVPFAKTFARPVISGFSAGAVVLGASGAVYLGANLEVAHGTLADTIHAEQSATMNAWINGEPSLLSVALSAPPCGHCRQFLIETVDGNAIRVVTPDKPMVGLSTLLPDAFGPAHLGQGFGLLRAERHRLQLAKTSADPVVRAALGAADASYAPYTGGFAGVAVVARNAVFVGRYAESVAFNPSVEPLMAALAGMALARVDAVAIERVVLVRAESDVDHESHTRRVLGLLSTSPLEVYGATSVGPEAGEPSTS